MGDFSGGCRVLVGEPSPLEKRQKIEQEVKLKIRRGAHIGYHVDADDIVQDVFELLMRKESKLRLRPEETPNQATWEGWAGWAIPLAISEVLRRNDKLTRGERQRVKAAKEAEDELSFELGRHPTTQEVAERVGGNVRKVMLALSKNVASENVYDFSSVGEICGWHDPNPESVVEAKETFQALQEMVCKNFSLRDQSIIADVIGDVNSRAELAKKHNVSRGRITQIMLRYEKMAANIIDH